MLLFVHMDTKIIPITDFIRKFGEYAKVLNRLDKLILTREGRPFAEVKATPEEKNRQLARFIGIWKDTKLDSDKFWKEVLTRRNRKKVVTL